MSSYRNKQPIKLILWSSQCKFWSVKPSTSPFLWPNLGKTEKNQIRKICTAAPSQLKAIAEKQGQHVEWLPLIIILMNIGNNYYFQWILIQCTNSYLQPPFRGANTSSAPCSNTSRRLCTKQKISGFRPLTWLSLSPLRVEISKHFLLYVS